jgi:mannose-1-phosphate guanylyltransferase
LSKQDGENIFTGAGHAMDAIGNFISSDGKFVAAIGVSNLVVVETSDALLICARERAQDVGKLVKWLEQRKLKNLL